MRASSYRHRAPMTAALPPFGRPLYPIFNEGYTASSGADIQRRELAHEAIRLTRMLHRLLPDDDEVTGLLALMLLTDARHQRAPGPPASSSPSLSRTAPAGIRCCSRRAWR